MKLPIIKFHYNGASQDGEKNTLPSKTKPDQSFTISQIIARSQKGLPVTGIKVPLYDEDLPFDFRNMDLTELHELKERVNKVTAEAVRQKQQAQEEAERKKTEEYYREKFKKEQQQKDALVNVQSGTEPKANG